MNINVAIHTMLEDTLYHENIPAHHVWFSEGFLHIKEGKRVTSYARNILFSVVQEERDSG